MRRATPRASTVSASALEISAEKSGFDARNCGQKLRAWGAGALQLMLQNADVEHKGTSVQVECDLGKVEGARRPPCPSLRSPPTPPAQSP